MVTSRRLRSLRNALLAATLVIAGVHDAYSQRAPGGGAAGGGTTGGGGTTTTTTGGGPSRGGSGGGGTGASTPSDLVTQSIVKNFGAVRGECARYDPVYCIDCVRQRLRDIARRIPQGPAYAEARQIINRAVDRLGVIQAANLDHAEPRQRSFGNARLKETKNYSAVKRQNLERAMEQARQVIDEAATQLLRAAENSGKRASHYQKIAAAVGSTKVLLRSA